ncbi:MAG: hypothetical protein EZS28_030701, partial [Streblomastix strix]
MVLHKMEKDLSPTDKRIINFDPFLFEIALYDIYSELECDLILDELEEKPPQSMCSAIRILVKLERANLILEYRACDLARIFGCAASLERSAIKVVSFGTASAKEEARLKVKQVDIEKYGELIRVYVNGVFSDLCYCLDEAG